MEFRGLKKQYHVLKKEIDQAIADVLSDASFIMGNEVEKLEEELAAYVGVKHCITCGNGTDALLLSLMAWGIGHNDAVFVPDYTFFSSAEVIAAVGAVPVFVDVEEETFNISSKSLENAIENVEREGILKPRAVIVVDLFGQPARYGEICRLAKKYHLRILEDGAQGFGGSIDGKMACSFGDISTTSFFPAKPLGCYGDGGAVFTNDFDTAALLRSLRIHGKGENKYDNVRIGMNSRLDTIQAAILRVKLRAFAEELNCVNRAADNYQEILSEKQEITLPSVLRGCFSSWAQYTVLFPNKEYRENVMRQLKKSGIPFAIYYSKPLHSQKAFTGFRQYTDLEVSCTLSERALSLPIHPYITEAEQIQVGQALGGTID